MHTLILSSRYTDDSQMLWRAAHHLGWNVIRLENWKLPKQTFSNPVVWVESLFAPMIAEQLGVSLPEIDKHWMLKLPYDFSKRKIKLTTYGEAKKMLPAFVKPPNDKSFAAKVYDELPSYIDDNIDVLVQEVVKWEKEFRCFCLNGKVETLSIYCRDEVVQKRENWLASYDEIIVAKEFAEKAMESIKEKNSLVIDVGIIKDRGWAVVEANAAWGSGICGCDPFKVLNCIKTTKQVN